MDPLLSDALPGRLLQSPFRGEDVSQAGLILATGGDSDHLDASTVCAMLASSARAKLVVPKSLAERTNALGIGYGRMVTTDSDLRVEYLDDRIYAVPSARPQLDWTPLGGYPYLGYLIRFGRCTIYHPGNCVPYDGLAGRLRPYNVTVALLPISGRPSNFEVPEAAQLAEDIGAQWLIPMHYGMFDSAPRDASGFLNHLLGHRPSQKFKILECGERWTVPNFEV